jgi:hypothetical protein
LSACTSRVPEPGESSSEPVLGSKPNVSDSSARSAVERDRAIERFSQSLAPRLSRSREGLTTEVTATGSRRIPLDGRFRSAHVAVRGADGSVKTHCVTSEGELDALLKRGRP